MDEKGCTGGPGGGADFLLQTEKTAHLAHCEDPLPPGVLAALRRTGQHSSLAQRHLAHVVPALAVGQHVLHLITQTLLCLGPTGPPPCPLLRHASPIIAPHPYCSCPTANHYGRGTHPCSAASEYVDTGYRLSPTPRGCPGKDHLSFEPVSVTRYSGGSIL